ncbi:hypothetical protein PQR71_12125 [Paraburkholderia fungorum]|uniref:hypothetical protein n=1 Tax=Paraburkholderia fungorum TaxID=134537 RepID=UPI0038B713DF
MGYLEDWNRGRNGELPNGRDNPAYQEGLKARQDYISGSSPPSAVQPRPPVEHHTPSPAAPFTLSRCAKSGASIFAICFALFAITSLHLSWAALAVDTALAAAAGAVAGFIFFVGAHALKIALRVGLIIVGISIALYFFGYTGPLNAILRAISQFI